LQWPMQFALIDIICPDRLSWSMISISCIYTNERWKFIIHNS